MKVVYTVLLILTLLSACGPLPGNREPRSTTDTDIASISTLVTGSVTLDYIETLLIPDLSHAPDGISAGVDGTIYICDTEGGRVIMLDRTGKTIASYDGSDTRSGHSFMPVDVSVAGGIEVYVLDSGTSRIIRLDRNLRNAYTIFSPGQGRDILFGTYRGIAFDRSTGDIFITDRDNGTVSRIDMLGGNVQSSGSFGQGRTKLVEPAGIDVADDGFIYIADSRSSMVAIQQHAGASLTIIGVGILEQPVDVAALPEGQIAVAERSGVVIFDRNGTPLAVAGFDNGPVLRPRAITFSDGILSVSDDASGGIVRFSVY